MTIILVVFGVLWGEVGGLLWWHFNTWRGLDTPTRCVLGCFLCGLIWPVYLVFKMLEEDN